MSQPVADTALQAQAALAAAGSGLAAITIDTTMYWTGVPLPVVLAALAGASLALSLLGTLSRKQAFVAVMLGTGVGTYLPPLFGWWLNVPQSVWPALGFALGLVAQVGLTALFTSAPGAVGNALAALIDRIRGR